MEIADDRMHQTLAYLSAASRRGSGVMPSLLDAYANDPGPISAKYRRTSPMTELNRIATASIYDVFGHTEKIRDAETMSNSLTRLGWASPLASGELIISELGRAVLSELNSPRIEVGADDPVSVIIDPEDPLAYARIFDLMSDAGSGLIVDPYLRMTQVFELLEIPAVTRILASQREMAGKEGVISRAVGAMKAAPVVALAEHANLHDRFYIADAGAVLIFGSSLNSITRRPGVVTPIADKTAAAAIRSAYEAVWVNATTVEAIQTAAQE